MKNGVVEFFSQFKNLLMLKKSKTLVVPYNKKVLAYIEVLYKEGVIQSYDVSEHSNIKIKVIPFLQDVKYLDKGKLTVFLKYKDICRLNSNLGGLFLTTSKGLKTLSECKKYRLGGILKFKV